MKIKFSKTFAAIVAATTLVAVSGISALADTSVLTTTEYDYNAVINSTDADIKVKSVITTDAANNGAQVTYLVATSTPMASGAIKYINQAPVDNGSVEFSFTAKQNEIYASTITAKFSSNKATVKSAMPTFAFAEGVDYYSTGEDSCTLLDSGAIVVDSANNKTTIYGKVNGSVSAYGIKVGNDKFAAKGTKSTNNGGLFAIVIYGWTPDATELETISAYYEA